MSLFDKLAESINEIVNNSFQGNDDFNQEEYDKYNNERIKEFKDRYDLTSVAGIRSIRWWKKCCVYARANIKQTSN